MALPYKQGKIALVLREMNNTGSEYEINGIDLDTSVFMWRKTQETYTVIPTSSYSISESSNGNTLVITDTETLSEIERLQIVSIINNEASTYDPSYKVDVTTLKDHYNTLVESFSEMFEYIKKTVIVADGQDYSIVLPTLNEGEVWVKTEDSWRGFYVGDIENQGKELRKLIENSRVSAIQDIENKRDSSLKSIEEEGTTQVNKVKDEGTTQTGLVTDEGTTQVNKVKTTGAERITAQGDFQVNRVIKTGDTQNTRVTKTGDFQNKRIITTGNGKVSDVTGEGNKQVTRVTGTGNTKVSEVTSEGTTQVGKVKTEGTKQIGLVTDEGYKQANRLIELSPSGIKQKPDSRACLAFGADNNGRPFLCGDTELTGWKTASVNHYGDSYIVTNPENTCNFISYKDSNGESKIYNGDSYKNLYTSFSPEAGVLYEDGVITIPKNVDFKYANKGALYRGGISVTKGYVHLEVEVDGLDSSEGPLAISWNMVEGRYIYGAAIKNGINIIKASTDSTQVINGISLVGQSGIYSNDITIKIIKSMVVLDSSDEKPIIPPQYTFPGGAVSFSNTENITREEYSFIGKGFQNDFSKYNTTRYLGMSDAMIASLNDGIQAKNFGISKLTSTSPYVIDRKSVV